MISAGELLERWLADGLAAGASGEALDPTMHSTVDMGGLDHRVDIGGAKLGRVLGDEHLCGEFVIDSSQDGLVYLEGS